MAGRRIARLNEQLKREITSLLQSEVRDPRIGFVSVTDVSVTPDLAYARVYVTVMGDEGEREETLAGLRAAAPYLRGELGRRLHIRRAPELRFEVDRTLEQAMRIERILQEVLPDRDVSDDGTDLGDDPAPSGGGEAGEDEA